MWTLFVICWTRFDISGNELCWLTLLTKHLSSNGSRTRHSTNFRQLSICLIIYRYNAETEAHSFVFFFLLVKWTSSSLTRKCLHVVRSICERTHIACKFCRECTLQHQLLLLKAVTALSAIKRKKLKMIRDKRFNEV